MTTFGRRLEPGVSDEVSAAYRASRNAVTSTGPFALWQPGRALPVVGSTVSSAGRLPIGTTRTIGPFLRTRRAKFESDGLVKVCLVSDPDLPADITERLCVELPSALEARVAGGVDWKVRRLVGPLVADEQLSVSDLTGAFARSVEDDDWDVSVFITDLPRRSGVRPVAAEISSADRIALVSLPALGPLRLYARTREAVVRLIGELMRSDYQPSPDGGASRAKCGRLPAVSVEPLSGDRDDPDRVRRLQVRWLGLPRMVGGMVRANRPWRLFLGLSRSLAGVFATAAYALINLTAWRLGISLGPARQIVFAALVIAVLVAWLVVDHELWERASSQRRARRARLYNLVTVLTLCLGVACLYAALLAGLIVIEQLLLTPTVVRQGIGVTPAWSDDLAIAWFVTSAAMIGGALGSGFEDDDVVRRAAYGARQRQRQSRNDDTDTAGG